MVRCAAGKSSRRIIAVLGRVRRLQWWRGLLAATAGAALEKLGDAVGGRSAVRCGTAALDALKPRAGAHRASGEVRASGWWLRLGRRVVVDPARELRDWRGARRGSRRSNTKNYRSFRSG